jgi:hypothetical protein
VVVAAVFFFPSGMRHGVRVGRVLLFPRGSAGCCTGNTLYLQGLVGYTCHTLLLSTRRYCVPVVSVSADRMACADAHMLGAGPISNIFPISNFCSIGNICPIGNVFPIGNICPIGNVFPIGNI